MYFKINKHAPIPPGGQPSLAQKSEYHYMSSFLRSCIQPLCFIQFAKQVRLSTSSVRYCVRLSFCDAPGWITEGILFMYVGRRLSICLCVHLSENFKLACNIWCIQYTVFMFGMDISWVKHFLTTLITLWPWPITRRTQPWQRV